MKQVDNNKMLTANEWWSEYFESIKEYKLKWEQLFDEEVPLLQKNWGIMVKKATNNITRIPGDALRFQTMNLANQVTCNVAPELTVEDRGVVLRDAKRGLVKGKNVSVYRDLFYKSMATEVNCRNIVRITGMSIGQFYKIMSELGANIRPFFSENKGENAGRWVIDSGILPEILDGVIDTEKDQYYLAKMFPNAPSWVGWSRWTNSRTHGLVFEIDCRDGISELLMPVHVDAENALVAIWETITGKKRREQGAIEYHRMQEQVGEEYVGAGLSELGCLIMVGMMRKAKKNGIIRDVKVNGEAMLSTTGTITEDDALMWEIRQAKRKMGGVGL